ncbi:hypothetical protein [Streptacidiphilus sp. PAMC 29251]
MDLGGPGAGPVTAIPELFRALCDDAAMFPPGSATAEAALPAHRSYREAWFAPLVGPFLVGTAQLAAVAAAADPGQPPLRSVLVVPGGPAELQSALDAAPGCGLELVGVELASPATGTPAQAAGAAVRALRDTLPPGLGGVVEVRRGSRAELAEALDVLAGTGYRAKLRTGGATAEAFPDAAEVASFLLGCVARSLPFKCTAGLHQGVRHTDPVTGFEHHGFLNILAATGAALAGADPREAAALLEQRDGDHIASVISDVTERQSALVRASFTGYGTCSITEPLAELAALGLLPVPHPPLPEHI